MILKALLTWLSSLILFVTIWGVPSYFNTAPLAITCFMVTKPEFDASKLLTPFRPALSQYVRAAFPQRAADAVPRREIFGVGREIAPLYNINEQVIGMRDGNGPGKRNRNSPDSESNDPNDTMRSAVPTVTFTDTFEASSICTLSRPATKIHG